MKLGRAFVLFTVLTLPSQSVLQAANKAGDTHISSSDIEKAVLEDLGDDFSGSKTIRYISFENFVNEGDSKKELNTLHQSAKRILNSLSWRRYMVEPKILGPSNALMRIDLREFGWKNQLWTKLEKIIRTQIALNHAAFASFVNAQVRNIQLFVRIILRPW